MKDQLPYVGGIRFTPAAASPIATGQAGAYVKSADGNMWFRKADGTETAWGAGGGGSSYYQTVKNAAGTAQTQRNFIQFGSGLTVTDDGTNTVVAASGGGGSFDATAPYTFTGLHTHAANITFDGDTRNVGDATHRAATVYALAVKSGASQLLIQSAAAAGANAAVVFDTATAFGSNKIYDFRTGGVSMMDVYGNGQTTYLELNRGDTGSLVGYFVWSSGGVSFYHLSQNYGYGMANNVANIASSTNALKSITSYQYRGTVQNVTATTNLTIDPAAGETVHIDTGVAISTITINSVPQGWIGQPGQLLTLIFKHTAGSTSLPSNGNWTNCKLSTGSGSMGSAINTRDSITFRFDSADSLWVEVGRATAMS